MLFSQEIGPSKASQDSFILSFHPRFPITSAPGIFDVQGTAPTSFTACPHLYTPQPMLQSYLLSVACSQTSWTTHFPIPFERQIFPFLHSQIPGGAHGKEECHVCTLVPRVDGSDAFPTEALVPGSSASQTHCSNIENETGGFRQGQVVQMGRSACCQGSDMDCLIQLVGGSPCSPSFWK